MLGLVHFHTIVSVVTRCSPTACCAACTWPACLAALLYECTNCTFWGCSTQVPVHSLVQKLYAIVFML
jgi:hypothetical protein